LGATVSALTVSALGLLGAGTSRQRRFGAGRFGAPWKVTVIDPVHLLYMSHTGRHVKVCPAGTDALTADATTRSEQSKGKAIDLQTGALNSLTTPIPYVPTYISYGGVPLSTAAAGAAAVAGQRRALGGGRRIHGGSMKEEG